MLHVWLIDELYLDGGKSLDPRPEVIGEDRVRRPRFTARSSPDLIAA